MCKEIGGYNTEDYQGNSKFVPAHTPVLIVSQSNGVRATIPTSEPTSTVIGDNKLFGSLLAREVADPLWASENEKTEYNETNSLVYVFGIANDIADLAKQLRTTEKTSETETVDNTQNDEYNSFGDTKQ